MGNTEDLSFLSRLVTSHQQQQLQTVQLVFYCFLAPIALRNFFGHRVVPRGRVGWAFLLTFCAMQAIGYGILKADALVAIIPYFVGYAILAASQAPLFFSVAGILHEAAYYRKYQHPFLFGRRLQILYHLLVTFAIGLFLVCAFVNVPGLQGVGVAAVDPLIIEASILLLMAWSILCGFVFVLWGSPGESENEARLEIAVMMAMPLLLLRVYYSPSASAESYSQWMLQTPRPLVKLLCLQAIPEFLIVLILAIAGLITDPDPQEEKQQDRYDENDVGSQTPQLSDLQDDDEISRIEAAAHIR